MKGKTQLKSYKKLSNFYYHLNIRMDEDPFAKKAHGISKNYHEVLLLTKFLQAKPQVKILNIIMIYIILLVKTEMRKKL